MSVEATAKQTVGCSTLVSSVADRIANQEIIKSFINQSLIQPLAKSSEDIDQSMAQSGW